VIRDDVRQRGERPHWRGVDLERPEMAIYISVMDISVTEFKHRCLQIIRSVERTGKPVTLTRRGKAVAHLEAAMPAGLAEQAEPWARLRGLGGRLLAGPGESVLRDEDFEASR
jgi:antitoxin (DNA-binding transcriptional repressor) of toxin-antitoxin stability system